MFLRWRTLKMFIINTGYLIGTQNRTGKRAAGERLSKNTRKPVWAAFVEIFRREFDDQCKCGHMLVRFEVRGCGAASEGCGAACSGHQPPPWLTRDSPQLFVSAPTFRLIPTFWRPDDSSRRKTDTSAQPRARTKPRVRPARWSTRQSRSWRSPPTR